VIAETSYIGRLGVEVAGGDGAVFSVRDPDPMTMRAAQMGGGRRLGGRALRSVSRCRPRHRTLAGTTLLIGVCFG